VLDIADYTGDWSSLRARHCRLPTSQEIGTPVLYKRFDAILKIKPICFLPPVVRIATTASSPTAFRRWQRVSHSTTLARTGYLSWSVVYYLRFLRALSVVMVLLPCKPLSARFLLGFSISKRCPRGRHASHQARSSCASFPCRNSVHAMQLLQSRLATVNFSPVQLISVSKFRPQLVTCTINKTNLSLWCLIFYFACVCRKWITTLKKLVLRITQLGNLITAY
jgi:hypothetical protein